MTTNPEQSHIREQIVFSRPPSIIARALAVFFGALLASVFLLLVSAWVVGRVLSDRYGWSQWLLWIPTPVALIASAAGILLAFRTTWKPRDGRVRAVLWSIATLFIVVYFVAVEYRLLRGSPEIPPDAKTLKLVHWNMGPATWHDMAPSIWALKRLHGDITIVTDPGGTLSQPDVKQWLGTESDPPAMGQLAVVTKLPIITFKPLIMRPDIQVVLVQIDATAKLGRLLTLYLVDMPSDLKLSRMALAKEVHELLKEQNPPLPDVVVGDFNMTRGGAALRTMFDGYALNHAYDEAGHGYSATFHREFPLWHIDQILTGPNVEALDYSISNPGIGRHRAQSVVIEVAK